MSRQQPALPEPSAERVGRIPDLPVGNLPVARATWVDLDGMWWFANRSDDPDEAGRFDLERPDGTCYFATGPVAALIEKLSDPDDHDPVVSSVTLERLQVWTGTLDHPTQVADATDRASRLPKEIGTVTPYAPCWAWADALHGSGRDGLMWWLRFDPGAGEGVGVFGPASDPDRLPDPDVWIDLPAVAAASDWREQLSDVFDIEDAPSLGQCVRADGA